MINHQGENQAEIQHRLVEIKRLSSEISELLDTSTILELNISIYPEETVSFNLRECCSGRQALMGYRCVNEPNHKGRCYSANKRIGYDKDSVEDLFNGLPDKLKIMRGKL